MYYIGVDLGGTGIKAGIVDEGGSILAKVSCPTGVERGYQAVVRDMADLCLKAVEKANLSLDDVKEQARRMRALRRRVLENDVNAWAERFLADLQDAHR